MTLLYTNARAAIIFLLDSWWLSHRHHPLFKWKCLYDNWIERKQLISPWTANFLGQSHNQSMYLKLINRRVSLSIWWVNGTPPRTMWRAIKVVKVSKLTCNSRRTYFAYAIRDHDLKFIIIITIINAVIVVAKWIQYIIKLIHFWPICHLLIRPLLRHLQVSLTCH